MTPAAMTSPVPACPFFPLFCRHTGMHRQPQLQICAGVFQYNKVLGTGYLMRYSWNICTKKATRFKFKIFYFFFTVNECSAFTRNVWFEQSNETLRLRLLRNFEAPSFLTRFNYRTGIWWATQKAAVVSGGEGKEATNTLQSWLAPPPYIDWLETYDE